MKNTFKALGLLALASAALLTNDGSAKSTLPGDASARDVAPTVFLLRHAETAASTETTRDPELSEAGQQRAAALARLLGKSGVSHLFASEFRRTQATLAPLAAECELELQVVGARDADALVEALRALPRGAVAVVAGHSNTVPSLVAALGGEAQDLVEHETYGRMLRSTEYDRLFVVPLGAGEDVPSATLELRYGAQ